VTAAALIARSRWRLCWGFAAYLAAGLSSNLAILLWPHRLYSMSFYLALHGLFEAARMWIALEIAWRVFREVRDARATLLVLGGIAVPTTAARAGWIELGSFAGDPWIAWFASGPLLVMAATLLIARWDRLTLDPFHAAILTSSSLFGVVFQLLIGLYPAEMSWQPMRAVLRQWEPFAYLTLLAVWAYAAWRPSGPANPPGGLGDHGRAAAEARRNSSSVYAAKMNGCASRNLRSASRSRPSARSRSRSTASCAFSGS
jgi:hypothetical protein